MLQEEPDHLRPFHSRSPPEGGPTPQTTGVNWATPMMKQAAHHIDVASTAGTRKGGISTIILETGVGSPLEKKPDHLQVTILTGPVESGVEVPARLVEGCPLVQEVEDDSKVATSRRQRDGLVSIITRSLDDAGILLDQPLDLG